MTNKFLLNHRVLWLLIPLLTLFNANARGANQTYTLVSDLSTLTNSDNILIVAYDGSNYYALCNNQVTSNSNLACTQVTITSNTITADLETNYTWYPEYKDNVTISSTSYRRYYFKSTKGTWYLWNSGNTGSQITTKNGTDAYNIWVVGYKAVNGSSQGCYGLWNEQTSRMFSVYNSTTRTFRAYQSGSFNNINGHDISIFKKAVSCDKSVGVTKGTATNGTVNTISSASVATCSSTASERRVTITITPAECYDAPSTLTWTKSSGTVTASKQSGPTDNGDGTYSYVYQFAQNDNGAGTFGVTCTAKDPGKTVNFDAGPGVSASASLTETCDGSGVTLPTVTASGVCKGWTTFAGWATSAVSDSTTTSGVTLYAAGSKYVPASDNMTLYAVYSKVKGGGSNTLTIYPSTYTNKGTTDYGSGAERTGTVGTINLGAHYVTGNSANTPAGSTTGQFLLCQGSNANIYNKTALPGKITQVVLNQNGATAFSLYCGTEQLMASNETRTGQTPSGTIQTAQTAATQMTWTVSGNYTYFDLKKGSSAGYISSIVVTYSSSTTYYCSDPNCCTPLASINGSF